MNGPIAQLVALTCHGNASLERSASPAGFFAGNSTCRFCDRVTFVELRRRLIGKPREDVVAATPDDWFAHLARTGARRLRLFHRPRDHPLFADRMTAGLVGGGAVWTIGARLAHETQYWQSDWHVWNRDAPEQRIWRVTYRMIATRPTADSKPDERARAVENFDRALRAIHAFAVAHDAAPFTDCFRKALAALADPSVRHGYHTDLCPDGLLPAASRAVLDAAQSAWVFGGMGSWNDLGFEGDAAREYEQVSAALYDAIQDAICAAVNQPDVRSPQ